MNPLRSLLVSALIILCLTGWSVPEAHLKANDVLVRVGSWCSGTIIDKKRGLVVTASHCIAPMKRVLNTRKETWDGKFVNVAVVTYKADLTVDWLTEKGDLFARAVFPSTLVGENKGDDVAILRITSSTDSIRDEAVMADTPVVFDDVVYAIGNPFMMPGAVSQGRVVQPNVSIDSIKNVILFSGLVLPGSSGGGLWNDKGQLVGITNWISPIGTACWAAPVYKVRALMRELKL
jgi:S1-C subfamily serine protease